MTAIYEAKTTLLRAAIALGIALGTVLVPAAPARAQLDVCGCTGSPASLGAFDSEDPNTYPPGSLSANRTLEIPLPADGVLTFDSFNLRRRSTDTGTLALRFTRNAANTPVTLLVAGDFTIGTQADIVLSGDPGIGGSAGLAGVGGLGGPGGFRGGDGAYQFVNFANVGGDGLGPFGGNGGASLHATVGNGTFGGNVELRPLIGGSAGGGGGSLDATLSCAGGGGGGGGGAILVAANGEASIEGDIFASGGQGGIYGLFACSSSGGAGSGGAIRIAAITISGTGGLNAIGGANSASGPGVGPPGRIALEALTNTLPGGSANPVAARFPAPGPVVNPLTPTVAITQINGAAVPDPPQGGFGEVDFVLAAPGPVTVDLATSGVPQGTTVDVTVKPRVGGTTLVENVELTAGACDAAGDCFPAVTVDLGSGAYTVEARATFATP